VAPEAPDARGDPRQAAARDGFERLRSRFIAGLPQRWADIVAAPAGPERVAVLHRLAGAAGSYGLTALGDAARAAEHAKGSDTALPGLRAQIEAAGVTVP
jgi:hypothetical protein